MTSASPLRAVADRLPARRRRAHRALQLALRPPARRRVRPADRRHRRRALVGRHGHRHPRQPAVARPRLGRRPGASAGRTRRIFRPSALDRHRAAADALVASGHAYYCYCRPDELKAKREAAEAAGGAWHVRPHVPRAAGGRDRARAKPPATPRAVRFLVPDGETTFDDLVHGPIDVDHANIEDFVDPAIGRLSDLPPLRRRRRRRDGRSRTWCAATTTSRTRRSRCCSTSAMGAPVPAFAHVPLILGPGQEAAEQAPRRDVGRRVREAGLPAGSDGELPRAARLVAGRRPGGVHARRAGRGVHARGHQRRQRRVQPGEARLVQPAAHHAAAGGARSSRACGRRSSAAGLWRAIARRRRSRAGSSASIDLVKPRARKLADLVAAAAAVSAGRRSSAIRPRWRSTCRRRILRRIWRRGAIGCATSTPFDAATLEAALRDAGRRARHQGRRADSRDARGGDRAGRQSRASSRCSS